MTLLLLLCLLFLPQEKAPEKSALSRTVVDSVTGKPVNKVTLRLEGLAQRAAATTASGATVLLAPDQRSRRDLFKNTTTDQRGHYEFDTLAPGNYQLFAWDGVELNQWYDPDFLKAYEKQAEKAALDPKGKATINPHIAIAADGH